MSKKFVCRTCFTICESNSSAMPLTQQVQLLFCFKAAEDILSDVLPELDLDIDCDFVLCNSCWSMIKSWYKFRRDCLANEKVFIEYIETQPVLRLSDVVAKIESHASVKSENEILEDQENVKSVLLQEEFQQVIGSESIECVGHVVDCNTENLITEHYNVEEIIKVEVTDIDDFGATPEQKINLQLSNSLEQAEPKMHKEEADELKMHVTNKYSSTVKIHRCKICPAYFASSSSLSRHLYKTHLVPKMFKCPHCDKLYAIESTFKKHLVLHLDPSETKCPNCSSVFETKILLYNHLRHCLLLRCRVCGDMFTDRSSYNSHMVRFHPKKKKKNVNVKNVGLKKKCLCNICGKSFSSSFLRIHLLTHDSNRKYVCEFCGRVFLYAQCLRVHLRMHKGNMSFLCDLCGLGFNYKPGYETHMNKHSGHKPHKCSICGKSYYSKAFLQKHVKNHRETLGRYPCTECGHRFKTRDGLRRHMLTIHNGERPYQCDICGDCFPQSNNVKQHRIRMHGRHDPFPIIRLSRAMQEKILQERGGPRHRRKRQNMVDTQERILRERGGPRHKRKRQDMVEKPSFTCNQCKKVFARKVMFEKHCERHNEKFECDICKCKFTLQYNLRRHKLKIHGMSRDELDSKRNKNGKIKKSKETEESDV